VGEALTNERKSSAALRDGLVAMARFIYDSANGDAGTNRDDIVVWCSSVTRSFRRASIRIGHEVYTWPRRRVGYRREAIARVQER
jgi:hypothetical protein